MDNKEFFAAFDDLCKEKGIGREEFIETLKNALNSAYKKQYDDGSEVFVDIDPEKGIFECNAVQKVVAEVTDRDREFPWKRRRRSIRNIARAMKSYVRSYRRISDGLRRRRRVR